MQRRSKRWTEEALARKWQWQRRSKSRTNEALARKRQSLHMMHAHMALLVLAMKAILGYT